MISHKAENFLKKTGGPKTGPPADVPPLPLDRLPDRRSGLTYYFFSCHLLTQREQAMSPVTFRQVRPMSNSRSTATMRPM